MHLQFKNQIFLDLQVCYCTKGTCFGFHLEILTETNWKNLVIIFFDKEGNFKQQMVKVVFFYLWNTYTKFAWTFDDGMTLEYISEMLSQEFDYLKNNDKKSFRSEIKITFSCFTIASPLDSSKNVADTTSKIFIHTFDLLISFIVLVIFNRQVSSSTKWKVDGLLNCKIDTTSWKLMIRVKSINWKTLESGRYCT